MSIVHVLCLRCLQVVLISEGKRVFSFPPKEKWTPAIKKIKKNSSRSTPPDNCQSPTTKVVWNHAPRPSVLESDPTLGAQRPFRVKHCGSTSTYVIKNQVNSVHSTLVSLLFFLSSKSTQVTWVAFGDPSLLYLLRLSTRLTVNVNMSVRTGMPVIY